MRSKEAKDDRESQHNEPNNVGQKQGLTRNRARPAITNLAEADLCDAGSGAMRVGASAPVGDAVFATHRVGSEALDGARSGEDRACRHRADVPGAGYSAVARKPENGGDRRGREGQEEERENGE